MFVRMGSKYQVEGSRFIRQRVAAVVGYAVKTIGIVTPKVHRGNPPGWGYK